MDGTGDSASVGSIEDLYEQVRGDDEALVRLCAAELRHVADYQAQVEDVRDRAVARLRKAGVPMTRLALLAGVSDSYLSRRMFGLGVQRKVNRRGH